MNNTQVNGTEGTRQVATIKVERVGEFERMAKTGSGWRSDDPSHESKMKVGIRVGNQVAMAELRYETDWNNPNSSLRSQRIVKHYGINDLVSTLGAVGIELDWTELDAEYKPLADAWQAEREQARQVACGKAWDEAWAHAFVRDARIVAIEKVWDMTFVMTPDRNTYISARESFSRDIRVQMTYKGVVENVWMDNGALKMYDDGFRTYRAKKVATIVEHFRDKVDAKISKQNRDQSIAQRRAEDLAIMQRRFPEYNITRPYNDSALRASLSPSEYSGRVSIGYATNDARTAESFCVSASSIALNEAEFRTIMDALKAAQKRSDDAEAARRAARNAQ